MMTMRFECGYTGDHIVLADVGETCIVVVYDDLTQEWFKADDVTFIEREYVNLAVPIY